MRNFICGLSVALALVGCSKPASGDAAASEAAAPTTSVTLANKDDACSLLSLPEIRRVLPQAARAQPNEALAEHGIHGCEWYSGSGKAPVLAVSVWQMSGDDDTPMDNVRTLAMGIADPTRAGAEASVRLETVSGVGEDAAAFVEKSDDARGILSSSGFLSLRQNGRIATVASSHIDLEDRAKGLEQLAALGKSIAARL